MRYSLQGYFDTGLSYGLADDAFRGRTDAMVPDILKIGIRNPLGLGVRRRMDREDPEVIRAWRGHALAKVDNPEMDLGHDGAAPDDPARAAAALEEHKAELRSAIEGHPIASCEITVYAVGVAFLRLDFAPGIPAKLLQGLAHCFEFAAYLEPVSAAILRAGKAAADAALGARPLRRLPRDSTLRNLARRPPPEEQRDEGGYVESRLFTAFTHVALCIDRGDDVEDTKRRLLPLKEGTGEPDSEPVRFEYHGTIHFNWAACVVEPKSFDAHGEPPEEQIERMLLCIQIAHVLHGACEAFERLFRHEAIRQAEGYIKGERGGLNHVELSRLRTLALAVVSLTNSATVAAAEEDRKYFALYEARAGIADLHKVILDRAEILMNVQQAEAAEEEGGRQMFLSGVALLLTGFTMLSVLADTYTFAKASEEWLAAKHYRLAVLALIVSLLVTVFVSVWAAAIRRSAARRR